MNLNQNLQHKLFLVEFISYPYDQNQLRPFGEIEKSSVNSIAAFDRKYMK